MPTVLLLKSDYERIGGPESLLRSLAENLDRKRFRPVLGVLRRPGQPPLAEYPATLPQIDIRWQGGVALPASIGRIAKAARQSGAALIHTHDMRANAAARVLRFVHPIPWIAHVHGWLGHTHRGRWRLYEAIDRRVVRAADLVLVGSASARREVCGCGVERVEIVPNFVPMPAQPPPEPSAARAELGLPPTAFLAGMLGRLHRGKGQHVFIAAMAGLARKGIEARGLIVGDGPERARLQALAMAKGVADRITFTGFVADATRYIAAVDVLAVPSLKESLPLTAIEAMSFARPVVASRAGDLPVLLGAGEHGMLVPVGDAAALAEALACLAADPDRRCRLGAAGRARAAAAYSTGPALSRLEACYADLIERCHGHAPTADADTLRSAE
ncbi:MAG TPA: glycosyltransferase family 4 protein [Stellaceae bacterium]